MTIHSDLRIRDGKLVDNWYVACLSKELASKPIQRIVYDQAWVLFRGKDGRPACLPDRCLHRHAQLSRGVMVSGHLACAYHGWTYDTAGQVVCIPSEGPGANCSRSDLKLTPRPCVEQDGCIWIWMGEGDPATKTPPFRFPHRDDTRYRQYFMVTDFDNEVTHLVENFMDVPHTVFVHAKWFRQAASKPVPISVDTRDGSVLVTYQQPQDKIGFTGRILNPKNEPMVHTDRFIHPNITRVDYEFGSGSAFIIISQCTPVTTLKSRVYTNILFRLERFSRPLELFFRFYTRRVIEQDVVIMKNQGESLGRDMRTDFHGTDADVVHVAIEHLRELARLGDPQVFRVAESVEKEIWI